VEDMILFEMKIDIYLLIVMEVILGKNIFNPNSNSTFVFSHILNYIRCDQMPPESVALDVLREAEFFCISSLIGKLENASPCVISLRRRESFRRLIPDYEHMKMDIINRSSEKRSSFHESRVVITQLDHTKLKGTIPCYNCSREFVTVNHGK
jgi:hypothetical protein